MEKVSHSGTDFIALFRGEPFLLSYVIHKGYHQKASDSMFRGVVRQHT